MTSLPSLIKRLEEATEGSRELDRAIWEAFGSPSLDDIPKFAGYLGIGDFTTSIDAAVALAGRLLPGWWLHGLGRSPLHGLWWCQLYSLDEKRASEAEDIKSAPLAICLATLRALLAQETEKA